MNHRNTRYIHIAINVNTDRLRIYCIIEIEIQIQIGVHYTHRYYIRHHMVLCSTAHILQEQIKMSHTSRNYIESIMKV